MNAWYQPRLGVDLSRQAKVLPNEIIVIKKYHRLGVVSNSGGDAGGALRLRRKASS